MYMVISDIFPILLILFNKCDENDPKIYIPIYPFVFKYMLKKTLTLISLQKKIIYT